MKISNIVAWVAVGGVIGTMFSLFFISFNSNRPAEPKLPKETKLRLTQPTIYSALNRIPASRVLPDISYREPISSLDACIRCLLAGTHANVKIEDTFSLGGKPGLPLLGIDLRRNEIQGKTALFVLKWILDSNYWSLEFNEQTNTVRLCRFIH